MRLCVQTLITTVQTWFHSLKHLTNYSVCQYRNFSPSFLWDETKPFWGDLSFLFLCVMPLKIEAVCFSGSWWVTVCWRKAGGCREVVLWAFVCIYKRVHNGVRILGKGQRARGSSSPLGCDCQWVNAHLLTLMRRVRAILLHTQSWVLATWVTTLSWKSSVYTLHCWVSYTL